MEAVIYAVREKSLDRRRDAEPAARVGVRTRRPPGSRWLAGLPPGTLDPSWVFSTSSSVPVKAARSRPSQASSPTSTRSSRRCRSSPTTSCRPRRPSSASGSTTAQTLDDLLIEAFAVVREAAQRTIGQRHYDVQLMGGAALHFGWVAEMKTGEGKTLVSTLPVYLNALAGKGVHLITVNDYLARRDAEWMGQHPPAGSGSPSGSSCPATTTPSTSARQYACDITYGTNNEFGFDYLRDNMAMTTERQGPAGPQLRDRRRGRLDPRRRGPHAAHHLRPGGRRREALLQVRQHRPGPQARRRLRRRRGEAHRRAHRGGRGEGRAGRSASRTSTTRCQQNLVHQFQAALKAKELFKRDKDYIIQHGEVKIVDEFTGRILEGRRWSEGLHQAVEAKEGVKIKEENQTLATITLQNYFRMYDKLAGMTGTAVTEAAEFAGTYNLQVVPIPTNEPIDPQGPGRPHLQDRGRPSSAPSSTTSPSATSRASRCWSAPSRSRSPRSCPGCSRSGASPTRC